MLWLVPVDEYEQLDARCNAPGNRLYGLLTRDEKDEMKDGLATNYGGRAPQQAGSTTWDACSRRPGGHNTTVGLDVGAKELGARWVAHACTITRRILNPLCATDPKRRGQAIGGVGRAAG